MASAGIGVFALDQYGGALSRKVNLREHKTKDRIEPILTSFSLVTSNKVVSLLAVIG